MRKSKKREADLIIRINEKMAEIETYLEQIHGWLPEEYEDYETDAKSRAACEKDFEVINEHIIDIAIYVIRIKKFRVPTNDESTFQILAEKNVISNMLCKKMIAMRGMRNFLAHKYGEINNLTVFDALKEQLQDDVREFLNNIKKVL